MVVVPKGLETAWASPGREVNADRIAVKIRFTQQASSKSGSGRLA